MELVIRPRAILLWESGGMMKSKSKRIRTTRAPVQVPRPAAPFADSSHGRVTRRGSTGLTEDRPYRRGSSDTASDPS